MFNISHARVWRNNRLYTISRMLHAVASVVIIIPYARWWFWAWLCCAWKLPNRSKGQKSALRDVERADFIRYWRRSGLKNPDKPKIFIKKNVRNHSHQQFYPVLPKIRINRGLLHFLSFLSLRMPVFSVGMNCTESSLPPYRMDCTGSSFPPYRMDCTESSLPPYRLR